MYNEYGKIRNVLKIQKKKYNTKKPKRNQRKKQRKP